MHPLFRNGQSFKIFLLFSLIVIPVATYLWWEIISLLERAGINPYLFTRTPTPPLLVLLNSFSIKFLVIPISIIIGSAVTAVSVVGPVRRIEQWLMESELGYSMSPLKSRRGDTYENLIRLINDFHFRAQNKSLVKSTSPRSIPSES
jgi:hypothetical protein